MSRRALEARTFLLHCRRAYSTSRPLFQESRPATAPRQYPPVTQIRDNVELYENNTLVRNYGSHQDVPRRVAENAKRIKELDQRMLGSRHTLKELQKQLNATRG